MDILIKSFNRPYYLERCIQSIYNNITDAKLSIKVLDDGTPEKYLEKIKKKFPDIQILRSQFYVEKSTAIENDTPLETTNIPIDLWMNTAKNASDYFLLLEDDIWFKEKMNLQESQQTLIAENIYSLKLLWLNNPILVSGKTLKTLDNITVYKPNVFARNPFVHRLIFGMKRYNLPGIMRFLTLYSDERALRYYSIYGVAGAIFKKEYFLNLWNKHQNHVDENLQLKNAVKFWHQNPKIHFARTNEEFVATGYVSSATNKNYEAGNFDVFSFNKILNKAWYTDEFKANDNLPTDFDMKKIENILLKENNSKAQVLDWKQWVVSFKKQSQDFGCNI